MALTPEERRQRRAVQRAKQEYEEAERLAAELAEYRDTFWLKFVELIALARNEPSVDFVLEKTSEDAFGEEQPGGECWKLSLLDEGRLECAVTSQLPTNRGELNSDAWRIDYAFTFLGRKASARLEAERKDRERRNLLARLTAEEKELLGLT